MFRGLFPNTVYMTNNSGCTVYNCYNYYNDYAYYYNDNIKTKSR